MLSIIIPVLDQSVLLEDSLLALQPLRARGHEVLVVDGGSRDSSVTIARKHADRVLLSGAGRALQMNAGSDSASHDILLFLPVTTRLPADADQLILASIEKGTAIWGFFDVQYSEASWRERLQVALRNMADQAVLEQAIFVHRHAFERIKGFDNLPDQEDIALCRKLVTMQPPAQLAARVVARYSI
jgi:glycosyltransferase involved in cell wall biosynthesis